jgi:hypothetical protein
MTLYHITYSDITSMKFDGDTKPRNGIKLDDPAVMDYWHLLLTITLTKRTPMKSVADAWVGSIQLKANRRFTGWRQIWSTVKIRSEITQHPGITGLRNA